MLDEKHLPFHDTFYHFVFLYISTAYLSRRLPYVIKDNRSKGLSNNLTNEVPILDQWKIMLLLSI